MRQISKVYREINDRLSRVVVNRWLPERIRLVGVFKSVGKQTNKHSLGLYQGVVRSGTALGTEMAQQSFRSGAVTVD